MIMGLIEYLMYFLSVGVTVPHLWNVLGYFTKIVLASCK